MKDHLLISLSTLILICFAVTIVAVSCGSSSNEVWTDPSTSLNWQRELPDRFFSWIEANQYCAELVLDGHDDWRLPTISELRSLIRGCPDTQTGGACLITDSCLETSCQDENCYSCVYGESPTKACYGPTEMPGECYFYWSSSAVTNSKNRAWAVGFSSAFVYKPRTFYSFFARCVR